METYELTELLITQGIETVTITFTQAKLMIVSEYGTRLWSIDVDGIHEIQLLERFADNENISIELKTTTMEGRQLEGRAFFHPNPQHRAAAIRGDGPLIGYEHQ